MDGLNAFADRGWKSKKVGVVRLGMTACLLHEKSPSMAMTEWKAHVSRLMEFPRILDYVNALLEAIVEAFPGMEAVSIDDPKATPSESSPGSESTTSRRSNTGARRRNSGG
jgi:hypothetical protein